MKDDYANRRGVLAAAMAAGFLIFLLGLTHRILAARLLTPVNTTPIKTTALEPLPMLIEHWTGEDIPFDEAEAIVGEIHAEATINRRYSRTDGSESILLFIAASGVTAGTLVGHPPEICNVVSGYTLTDQRSVELPLPNATKLPCRVLHFVRGGPLHREKKVLLYYYLAGSEFCGSRSQLRLRVRRGPNMVNCVAQVQIAVSSAGTVPADSATQLVCDFAADSAAEIAELFKQIETEQSINSTRAPQEGSSR